MPDSVNSCHFWTSNRTAVTWSVDEFATAIGCETGVSGYAYHSIPVALFSFLRHAGEIRPTVAACVACGGDTDSVAAIAGALAGAWSGSVPDDLLNGIIDWPLSTSILRRTGESLSTPITQSTSPITWWWPMVALRNLVFLIVVLIHGFRRLLPPY
jgi:hypothetical protein